MFQLTPVVKNLVIINVLFFFGSLLIFGDGRGREILALSPPGQGFKPYQLVTHMFMHANFQHILFNMFGLVIFGTAVEQIFGPKRFLGFYLACGFGALALHLISPLWTGYASGAWGASGAVMGVSVAYAVIYPHRKLMLLFPPIPVKAWILVSFFVLLDLYSGFGTSDSGIAHFAHIGGAIVGFVLTYFWKRKGFR